MHIIKAKHGFGGFWQFEIVGCRGEYFLTVGQTVKVKALG